ncbi:MAG: FtsX-like permease family protein [Deltaproteobacteria bacterium]|nr:FtsX-like permease family protein [Deltaproteobacteria bacterium]
MNRNFIVSYLFKRRERSLIRIASLLTIIGVSFAVTSQLTGFSILSGFEKEYLKAVLNFNAPLVVMKTGEMEQATIEEAKLKSWFETKQSGEKTIMTPFLYREGLIVSKQKVKGVVMKGVDLPRLMQASGTKIHYFEKAKKKEEGLLIGSALAKSLGLSETNRGPIYLFLPEEKVDWQRQNLSSRDFHSFPVVGTFESGLYDYDAGFVFLSLPVAQKLLKATGKVTGIEVWLADPEKGVSLADEMKSEWHYPYSILSWWDLNEHLFQALKLQKLVFGILLGFLVLVSSFNLTGILVMKMLERRRDVAVLRVIGATLKDLKKIFLTEGLLLGGSGLLIGTLLALILSTILSHNRLIALAPEIYFISSVPSVWQWHEVFWILAGGVAIIVGAVWFSLSQLGRLNLIRVLTEG